MAIVITGILAGIVAVFITRPVQGYVDSVRRAELTDAADVALRRITRDVRLALPNSLRVSGGCIEFIATSTGGRYRDPGDGSTNGDFLSFTDTTDKTFDVLGPPPSVAAADYVVIYNLGPGYKPADAYCSMDPAHCPGGAPTGGNVATVSAVGGNTVTLASNPFALQGPPLPSPNSRFQVVPSTEQAVSYVCAGGELRRYSGYGFNASQICPPGGAGALLAGSAAAQPKATCVLDYASAVTGRNGLLYVQLTLTDVPSTEAVTLVQQIHVDNSP